MRTVKDKFRDDFSNGWYIEQSSNCRSSISEKIELFAMKKDNEDGTKSIRYYFAKDVVRILVDECGAVVVKNKTLSIWLNDNPFNYKPKKGCKISFHNEDETINLLN